MNGLNKRFVTASEFGDEMEIFSYKGHDPINQINVTEYEYIGKTFYVATMVSYVGDELLFLENNKVYVRKSHALEAACTAWEQRLVSKG